MNENCIFCKIANGEIPSYTVYEDDAFRAILDAAPANEGHTLIIPKTHHENIFDLPEDLARKVVVIAQKIALLQKERLQCDGVNIMQNNGELAGQTVMHYHMHVIPRFEGDNHFLPWKPKEATPQQQQAILEKLCQGQ